MSRVDPAYPPPPPVGVYPDPNMPSPGAPPPYPGVPPNYPGAPPTYPGAAQPTTTTTVIVQRPGLGAASGAASIYRDTPAYIVCQYCNATVTTQMIYSVGMYTFLIALIFILIGRWLGCCLIPFFMNSCKDVVHTCPNCTRVVGRYSKFR